MTNFTNTTAAIQAWAIADAEHHELAQIADCLEDFDALDRDRRIAANKLRDAFYEDTKHINSRNHVSLMEPTDIIKLIASPGVTIKQYLDQITGAN